MEQFIEGFTRGLGQSPEPWDLKQFRDSNTGGTNNRPGPDASVNGFAKLDPKYQIHSSAKKVLKIGLTYNSMFTVPFYV